MKQSRTIALAALLLVLATGSLNESRVLADISSTREATVVGNRVSTLLSADASLARVATRLQARLRKRAMPTYPETMLTQALQYRRKLLSRSLDLTFTATDGTDYGSLRASVASHPDWLRADAQPTTFRFVIDDSAIAASLSSSVGGSLPAPIDSTITGVVSDGSVMRAEFDRPAEPGYLMPQTAVSSVHSALEESTFNTLAIHPVFTPGKILNASGKDLGSLDYLASGQSNFAGSGGGRISNVRLGISQFINGVIIPAGATFSFNEAVHNMNLSEGWQEALVIVNGKDLVPFPGGGICQVATTTYRAALNAGLPIVDRANHSLYVTYYEKYGVGIDATVFPGKQDLTFTNDTGHDLLLQAYTHGFEATVNVYGVSDGRSVALEGPFFSGSDTSGIADLLQRPLSDNEIAWVRQVSTKSGHKQSELILSHYNSIPEYLHLRYASVQWIEWMGKS